MIRWGWTNPHIIINYLLYLPSKAIYINYFWHPLSIITFKKFSLTITTCDVYVFECFDENLSVVNFNFSINQHFQYSKPSATKPTTETSYTSTITKCIHLHCNITNFALILVLVKLIMVVLIIILEIKVYNSRIRIK